MKKRFLPRLPQSITHSLAYSAFAAAMILVPTGIAASGEFRSDGGHQAGRMAQAVRIANPASVQCLEKGGS